LDFRRRCSGGQYCQDQRAIWWHNPIVSAFYPHPPRISPEIQMASIAKSAPECDAALAGRYSSIRALTEQLAAPLGPEDQAIQSMAAASPVKWHRAHTTWFFETIVLLPYPSWYSPYDSRFY